MTVVTVVTVVTIVTIETIVTIVTMLANVTIDELEVTRRRVMGLLSPEMTQSDLKCKHRRCHIHVC